MKFSVGATLAVALEQMITGGGKPRPSLLFYTTLEEKMEVILGVDVSSQKLDACLQSPKHAKPMFKTVAYTPEGCKKLLTWATRHKVTRCAMEATGGYELTIAKRIMHAGIKLYIANPNRIRHFAKGDGILAKTDKIDAFVIAEFARKSNFPAAFESSRCRSN